MNERRIEKIAVRETATISEAFRQIDESGERIVFVVDEARHLLGVATDGDIRRWILSGRKLDAPITEAMNCDPISVGEDWSREQVEPLMVSRRVETLPVLDASGVVVDAVRWVDLFEARPRDRGKNLGLPVVVMAGGEGTRLGPLTKVLPKPLVPLGDTPIVDLIIDRLAQADCGPFYLSINYKANLIKAYFSDVSHQHEVLFVEEDQPLGTAGSLSLLRDVLDKTFIVTNCDILVEADYGDVVKLHRESGNLITLVASMKHFTIPYGVCDTGDGGALTAMHEKPHFDYLVSTGFYVLEPEVLDDIPDGTFVHLTDVINTYLDEGKKVGVYPISEKDWIDVGQLEELQSALDRLGLG